MPFRRWYLWCADGQSRRHAQEFISQMLAKRWAKMRTVSGTRVIAVLRREWYARDEAVCPCFNALSQVRMLHEWLEETEQGTEQGRGREELLSMLSEQQALNKAHEDTIGRCEP